MSATAARRCASRSIRSGPIRPSTRSASTTTRRSPTGATARTTLDLAEARSGYGRRLSAPAPRRGRGLRLVLRERTAHRLARPARRSPTAPTASPGSSARRTSCRWWSNPHVERVGGVETAATAWVPRAKPIWLTEIGVPAVDKGANGPNVFPDPKSSEIGRAAVLARHARRPRPGPRRSRRSCPASTRRCRASSRRRNPVSPVYGGRMVDPAGVFRLGLGRAALPGLPGFRRVWADGPTGRPATGSPAASRARRSTGWSRPSCADFGIDAGLRRSPSTASSTATWSTGRCRPAARSSRSPACSASTPSRGGGRLLWRGRGGRAVAALDGRRSRARPDKGPSLRLARAAGDGAAAPGRARLHGRRRGVPARGRGVSPLVRREPARDGDRRGRRDPPRRGAAPRRRLAPGPLGRARDGRVRALARAPSRSSPATSSPCRRRRPAAAPRRRASPTGRRGRSRPGRSSRRCSTGRAPPSRDRRRRPPPVAGRPEAIVLDLPVARGEPTALQYLAVAADPWPGAVAVWRSARREDGFALHRVVALPALVGRTLTALAPGPLWRWDRAATLDVRMRVGRARLGHATGGARGRQPLRASGERRPLGDPGRGPGRAHRPAHLPPLPPPARARRQRGGGGAHRARRARPSCASTGPSCRSRRAWTTSAGLSRTGSARPGGTTPTRRPSPSAPPPAPPRCARSPPFG